MLTDLKDDFDIAKEIYITVDSNTGSINEVTKDLQKIYYNYFVTKSLKDIERSTTLIKKVNFNKPFKKSTLGFLFGEDVDVDLTAPTTELYYLLRDMYLEFRYYDQFLEELNNIREKFETMINDLSKDNITNEKIQIYINQLEIIKRLTNEIISLKESTEKIFNYPGLYEFYQTRNKRWYKKMDKYQDISELYTKTK